jgi:hypothetical protein
MIILPYNFIDDRDMGWYDLIRWFGWSRDSFTTYKWKDYRQKTKSFNIPFKYQNKSNIIYLYALHKKNN